MLYTQVELRERETLTTGSPEHTSHVDLRTQIQRLVYTDDLGVEYKTKKIDYGVRWREGTHRILNHILNILFISHEITTRVKSLESKRSLKTGQFRINGTIYKGSIKNPFRRKDVR